MSPSNKFKVAKPHAQQPILLNTLAMIHSLSKAKKL